MPIQYMVQNATGDITTDAIALTSSQSEIIIAGTFDGAVVTFEDNKYGLGWADVIDKQTREAVSIDAPTNEIQVISATNTGRSIRATISGSGSSTDITIGVDQGIE